MIFKANWLKLLKKTSRNKVFFSEVINERKVAVCLLPYACSVRYIIYGIENQLLVGNWEIRNFCVPIFGVIN